ncbi:MAG: ATP-dependent zinc protease [Rhodospirillales bacterium]|nr:ATP-dependent zinc protease [Rhodospirillales bacterium]
MGPKTVVGWREWVALPMFDIDAIKVKIDTGARTSAVHAFNIKPFHEDGADWVRFDVRPLQRNDEVFKTCKAEVVDYRWVTNSGGGREKRFVVVTMLRLGFDAWPIEVTLTDRDQMGFRMLLGRTAMERRLIVDPALSYCLGKRRNKKRIRKTEPVHDSFSNEEEEE